MENKVIIGEIYHEQGLKMHRFWGATWLRRGEFRAVAGHEESGDVFELPLITPAKTIHQLKSVIFASPVGYMGDWKRTDNARSIEYEVKTDRGLLSIYVHNNSIYIESKAFTLSRSTYKFSGNLTLLDEKNAPEASRAHLRGWAWELKPSSYDTFTEAGRREFMRVVGCLMADFLAKHPAALVEGRNAERAYQRRRIAEEIQKHENEIIGLRTKLAAIGEDEPIPADAPALSSTELETQTEGGA